MSADTGSRRPGAGRPGGSRNKGKGKRAAGGRQRPPESGAPAEAVEPSAVVPAGSAAALEAQIQARRDHLAATIDELTSRAAPKALARQGVAGVQAKIRTFTHTPEGQLRVERLAAAGAAVVALGTAMIWLRRRR